MSSRRTAVTDAGATTHQSAEALLSRTKHRACSISLGPIRGHRDIRRLRRPNAPRSNNPLADADCLSRSWSTHSAPSTPVVWLHPWGGHEATHAGKSTNRSTRSRFMMDRAADTKSKLWRFSVPRPLCWCRSGGDDVSRLQACTDIRVIQCYLIREICVDGSWNLQCG